MSTFLREIKAIYQRKDLIKHLTLNEIRGYYKGTFLGFLWMILDPLFMMLVYVVLVTVIFKRGGPQFPILLFSALIAWRWFLQSANNSIRAYGSNGKLIQTISVPLAVFPITKVLVGMTTFLASFVALIPMLFIFDATINLTILWLPLIVVVQLLFTLGVSLIFSVAGVYFTDLFNIMQFLLKLVFYLSPALYSLSAIPEKFHSTYLICNPFASLFESYKNVLIHGVPPNKYLLIFAAEAIILVIVGTVWASKHRSKIVKKL